MDVYVGFITAFGFDWAPQDWSQCNGATIPLQQYTALFSLIGVRYGGNGVNNFMLPDLRGRTPVGQGQGAGLTPRVVGQQFGTETTTLTAQNMPAHTHTQTAYSNATELTQTPAAGWALGAAASVTGDRPPVVTPVNMYKPSPLTPQGAVQSQPSSVAGGSLPFDTMQPSLCINFCIALNGIYPNRP